MNRSKRIACILGAIVAVLLAVSAPAFACDGQCGGGAEVFSAPVYQAPQVFAAPVYQAPVFAAPVYQQPVFRAPVYQQRQVFAAPVYQQAARVDVRVRAPRQPLFGFRSRSVQRNVVRGNAAAAVVY
jgi:hypothetical protein